MKQLELDEMPRFGELTHALLTSLGNEEFGLFLEGVIRRYQKEYHSKEEEKEKKHRMHDVELKPLKKILSI